MLSEPVGVDIADVKHDLEKVFLVVIIHYSAISSLTQSKVTGVLSVHELHLWRLNEEKSCATVHVVIGEQSMGHFRAIAKTITECLHAYGIHSATIQPEVARTDASSSGSETVLGRISESSCDINCGKICEEKRCCP